jgi:L-alanine-DL-glutamate epimerase-like enolase superfamily enzyme
VEQPYPAEDLDSFHRYRELPDGRPVFVDVGGGDAASLPAIASYADGAVVKLAKCGGIREARRMLHVADVLGLQVMLGCMIESQLGIAQAAQLGALADHADLDGHLLITDEPFTGLGLADGRLVLPDAPGLGVVPAATQVGVTA